MNTSKVTENRKIIITGSAGFIGFHLTKLLLDHNFIVFGYDGLTDYYDVTLKEKRTEILSVSPNFNFTHGLLEEKDSFDKLVDKAQPEFIIHLAAQAGVRYSLQNPQAYIDTNILGTFNVMEAARRAQVKHLLMASTSSVYGARNDLPFSELDKCDSQLTVYAATKKANESMAHAYSHLWKIPTTMLRFFTVYGAWGRPDLVLYKFVDAILDKRPIDIYNHGAMHRDFTYVTDLVQSIRLLINVIPGSKPAAEKISGDSLSSVAPYRIVNIGNSQKVNLMDFIEAIETSLNMKAEKNYMPIQQGDVPNTLADVSLLHKLTGYTPSTDFRIGINHFVKWFRAYYGK